MDSLFPDSRRISPLDRNQEARCAHASSTSFSLPAVR
jgi:hypothetical protein